MTSTCYPIIPISVYAYLILPFPLRRRLTHALTYEEARIYETASMTGYRHHLLITRDFSAIGSAR